MKKCVFLIIQIILFNFIHSQQVPNGNFENWYNESNYQNPQFWDTPNSVTGSLNIFTVTKETAIVQNGTASAKIQSKSIFGTPIPGLITLGDFNVNINTFQSSIEGGYPFTHKPNILKGYYQYEPVSGDQAFIGVVLLKQNGSLWDTIASGNFRPSQKVINWMPFTININYFNTQITPTHLNIIILSSDKDYPQPNSILYIDNLTFEYNNSVNTETIKEPFIQANKNQIQISNIDKEYSIEIFDITGRLIIKEIINSNKYYNLKNNSIFIVQLKSNNYTKTQKIVTN
jgi:hypothetical protein